MRVPLLDLRAQYASIKDDIDSALLRVAESQHFILGPEVETLERSMCEMLGCKYAFGVSSGTDALLVALMAVDIKAGDEVIVPTYSFFATAGVVARLNAVPVFVDIDPVTFNIDPKDVERRITKRTRAIIPVHLYGQSADMAAIMKIAANHSLKVIEDAAQAIGAQYADGRKVGTIGDVGCYSFFPSKNLGGFGDGGMVVTNDDTLAERLRIMRVHGAKPKYYHKVIGGNFRLDAIQAAVLNVKVPHLEFWSRKRQENAALYAKLFIEAGLAEGEGKVNFGTHDRVLLPKAVYADTGNAGYHIYNQYVIRVEKRDDLRQFLNDREVGTEIYYPVPFHRQECFRHLKYSDEEYPNANFAAEHSLALPIYPELSEDQITYVVQTMKDYFVSD